MILLIACSDYLPVVPLLLPGLLAVLGIVMGLPALLIAIAAGVVLRFAFFQNAADLLMLLAYIPASIVLSWQLRRRGSNLSAAVLTCAFTIVGMWVIFYVLASMNGQSISGLILDQLSWSPQEMAPLLPGIDEETLMQTHRAYTLFAQTTAQLFLSILIFIGMFSGLLSLLIARGVSRRFGAQLAPMSPLSRWQLPRHFSWGILTLCGGLALLWALNLQGTEPIVSAVQVIILMPLLCQGASLLQFFMLRNGMGKAGSMTLVILISVLLSMLLVFVGAMEQALRLRKRVDESRK